MINADEKATLLSKRKNIQTLLDYCLEQKITFTASPRAISNDEWEIEMKLDSVKQAIALGMFARDNKVEVLGMGELAKPVAKAAVKKTDAKEAVVLNQLAESASGADATLKFDLDNNSN